MSLDSQGLETEVTRNQPAYKMRKVLNDLVQMAQQVDPSGETRDFTKRKKFNYYDPYNPTDETEFAHLKYEDEAKFRASIIVDIHKQNLDQLEQEISPDNFTDKERLKQVRLLMDRLRNLRVIDGPVLIKLFNLYRYKLDEEVDL